MPKSTKPQGQAPAKTKEEAVREQRELHAAFWAACDDALVDRSTMAAGVCMSKQWASLKAIKGGGPAYIILGQRALYKKRDVLDWLQNFRRVRNTSEISMAVA